MGRRREQPKPRRAGLAFCLLFLLLITSSALVPAGQAKDYLAPDHYERAIRAFEAMDREAFPPPGAIVFVGSSSMSLWAPTIHQDFAPLTIILRGFGGSNMHDALHYVDRIVIPYRPRAVVVYEGDNDVAEGIAPQTICATFQVFAAKVHAQLPAARIYFLSIKPSICRWPLWPRMKETNRLIRETCEEDRRLVYVDVASAMLDANGEPRRDIYLPDDLHMNHAGYAIWRSVVRPILLQAELPYEIPREHVAPAAGSTD